MAKEFPSPVQTDATLLAKTIPTLLDVTCYVRLHTLLHFIKQLLDEVEHDIMNYQNRGLCYLPKPKAEADNTDNICSRYCIYHVKFTSYCELIDCSRLIRFFKVSLMYNNGSYWAKFETGQTFSPRANRRNIAASVCT